MAMDQKDSEDVLTAQQILDELHKLIASEKSETEPSARNDARLLEDAAAKIEGFIAAERGEEPTVMPDAPMPTEAGIVDTSLLTGPINGLKNFLIKKSQENA